MKIQRRLRLKTVEDTKKAEADAAYSIQQETQRKTIEITKAQADIAKQEQEITRKQKEASVKEQELNAQIRKQADADKYRQQQMAEVDLFKRQKEAEAKKFEFEKAAEAKRIQAEADKYAMEQEAAAIKAKAEAEAAAIKAKGEAEAAAIQAKAEAEAAGIDKKAEAMKKYGEAAVIEMLCKMYPEVARAIAEPLGKIDKITMYGDGNTARLTEDVTKSFKQTIDGLSDSLGVDLNSVATNFLKNKGGDAKQIEAEADDDKTSFKEVETDDENK